MQGGQMTVLQHLGLVYTAVLEDRIRHEMKKQCVFRNIFY